MNITKPVQQDGFRVERSTHVKAAPSAIFPLIDDFHNWPQWSPYEGLDPSMARTYAGAAHGEGAVYAWEGKGKAGAGRMEIRRSAAPSRIVIQLDFSKPFKASNTAEFTLEPDGDDTRLTWAMYGPQTLFSRVMGVFFSMDSIVGKDFEAGLAALKRIAEG